MLVVRAGAWHDVCVTVWDGGFGGRGRICLCWFDGAFGGQVKGWMLRLGGELGVLGVCGVVRVSAWEATGPVKRM